MTREGSYRYNLVMPIKLFDRVEELARREKISVAEILRGFIKLGLRLDEATSNGADLILRQGDKELVIELIL